MLLRMRNEPGMRLTEFTDEHGVRWITSARAAEIWNERAVTEYNRKEGIYTRWSIYQRKDLPYLDLPGGRVYREDKVREVKLRPHPPNPHGFFTTKKKVAAAKD